MVRVKIEKYISSDNIEHYYRNIDGVIFAPFSDSNNGEFDVFVNVYVDDGDFLNMGDDELIKVVI